MVIWTLYFVVTVSLLAISTYEKVSSNTQKIFRIILILWLIYFSTFRDSIGEDYSRYVVRMHDNYFFGFFDEPAFSLIFLWIRDYQLSYILFFFITSILTVLFSVLPLFKLPAPFFSILTFLIHFGGGYIQSFNAIRQCVATGFFIFSYQYILERKVFLYTLIIICASFFHLSALLLLPIYWIVNKKFPQWIMITVLLVSIFYPQFLATLLSLFIPESTDYSDYLNGDFNRAQSGLFLVISFLFLIILMFKKKFDGNIRLNSILNLGYISVVLFNLSAISIAFSRFSLFFMPFMYVSIYYLSLLAKNKLIAYLILSFFVLLFFISVSSSGSLPEKILPINSLWDEHF